MSPDAGLPRRLPIPTPVATAHRPRFPIRQWFAAAAAILVIIGVGYWMSLKQWHTRESRFEAQISTLNSQAQRLLQERDDSLRSPIRSGCGSSRVLLLPPTATEYELTALKLS